MENINVSPRFMDPILLREHLTNFKGHLLHHRHFSAQTAKCYQVDLEQFFSFIRKPINEITDDDVSNYVNNKLCRYADATVARKIASLRTFFKWGLKSKVVEYFPFKNIKSPKTKRKEFDRFRETELVKLFDQMDETQILQLRDKCIFLLCLNYGLKPVDVLLIRICDINLTTNTILISSKKSKVKLKVSPETMTTIKKYLDLRQDTSDVAAESFLFVNKHQQPLSTRSVRRKLAAYANLAGFSREINPMSLRHHFAMQSIANGKDVHDLQKELGHQNVATTAIYINAIRKQDKRNASQSNSISQCFSSGSDV